ncbi:MAG: hypothetical protein KME16_19685 [Scytolyngbya sp. HA4215-MV1]|jgi:hypothetical protein|nr:hypothetical protein [Scytolyngbya sp. HA4215-MV1]
MYRIEMKQPIWQTIAISTLAFWLSGSLLLDMVVMPGLYAAGMMDSPEFASAGYLLFGIFNRIELVCAGLVASCLLAACYSRHSLRGWSRTAVAFSLLLLSVVCVYTYLLVPQMSALSLPLDIFQTNAVIPAGMNSLHMGYWLLEAIKLATGLTLLGVCYRRQTEMA